MKGKWKVLIAILSIGALLAHWWLLDNTRACYFAKGIKTLTYSIYFNDKIVRRATFLKMSIGDYYSCAYIGETL